MDATVASWSVWSKRLGFKDKLKAAGVSCSWPTVDSSIRCERLGPRCEILPIASTAMRGRIAVIKPLMVKIRLLEGGTHTQTERAQIKIENWGREEGEGMRKERTWNMQYSPLKQHVPQSLIISWRKDLDNQRDKHAWLPSEPCAPLQGTPKGCFICLIHSNQNSYYCHPVPTRRPLLTAKWRVNN